MHKHERTIMVSWISRRCFVMLPILVRNRRRSWMISVRCASLSPSDRCRMGHALRDHVDAALVGPI